MFHNTVATRARELVILRTSWRAGSEYVFCHHVRIARDLGIADEDILGARDPHHCRTYTETDLLVLGLADELHDRVEVTPATWTALAEVFRPEELVELVLAAGVWRAISAFAKSAQISLDAGVPTWPEGRRP
jgi:4-carboxymuconolactone decarboxylase